MAASVEQGKGNTAEIISRGGAEGRTRTSTMDGLRVGVIQAVKWFVLAALRENGLCLSFSETVSRKGAKTAKTKNKPGKLFVIFATSVR